MKKLLQNVVHCQTIIHLIFYKTITKLEKPYDFVIVIPICNESPDCLTQVFKNIVGDLVLVIAVVISPVSHQTSSLWKTNNSNFISDIRSNFNIKPLNKSLLELYTIKTGIDLLIIDRNSKGLQIPEKKGVGLARKIGADIALKLFSMGSIKCSWIHSTDADVELPKTYFNQVYQIAND